MDHIIERRKQLREEIDSISSNRGRLDHIKDYYAGKTAIVIGTGPGFLDHIDVIKENLNENTIVICIKQGVQSLDDQADFHVYNTVHYQNYKYQGSAPIRLMVNIPERRVYRPADIHFYMVNMPGEKKNVKVNNWESVDKDIDTIPFGDKNNGPGENMVVNTGHILMEVVFPLCVHLGVKNIVINGLVGGPSHGINVGNEVNWERNKHLYRDDEKMFRISEKLHDFFVRHYNIEVFLLCESNYKIPRITHEEYVNIVTKE